MKKILLVIFALMNIVVLTGCGGCENLSEDDCKHNDKCLSNYKPCSSSAPGCKDNILFVQCKAKKAKTD